MLRRSAAFEGRMNAGRMLRVTAPPAPMKLRSTQTPRFRESARQSLDAARQIHEGRARIETASRHSVEISSQRTWRPREQSPGRRSADVFSGTYVFCTEEPQVPGSSGVEPGGSIVSQRHAS